MAVKISESEWADFTKKAIKDGKLDPKLKLDDAALVKALGACDKADAAKAEPHLKALDELIKQIPEQVKALVKRKKELGDKPFGQLKDKLYELLEAAEGQRKTAQDKAAEAKAAESKSKGKADEDDEEETPALLTTKMIPLLRELKKGEVTMPCLIALAGKETVVLLSRKPISPARGKLLKEQMEKPTGLKFIRGDSMYEKGALTFVVQSPGAALAKRLRQALLDQTQLRLKVKVRGEDGVEELDGEEDNLEQDGTQTQNAPPGGPASAEQLAYTQRLLKVRDRYEQALKQQHPEATKLRALMGLASEKADKQKNYAAAIQALQALEKALDASTDAPSGGIDPDAAFKARLTALIPRLKEAQTAGHPGAEEAKLKASEAGMFARKKDYERANGLLDEVERKLGQAAAGAAQSAAASAEPVKAADPARDFNTRLAALLSRLKELAPANPALVDAARALIRQAGQLANKKDLGGANQLLDQVDSSLDSGQPLVDAARAPKTQVQLQTARLAWDGLRKSLQRQLQSLVDALTEAVAEHNADPTTEDEFDTADLARGVQELHGLMQSLDERLIDKLDQALNAQGEQRLALQGQAAALVRQYQAFVDGNELIRDIDNNGFLDTSIHSEAQATLGQLARQL